MHRSFTGASITFLKLRRKKLVKLIEIPFTPDATHGWSIPIPGDGEKQFSSRDQALAFAQTLAKNVRNETGHDSCLCVQGADGRWRLFTEDLVPVREPD